MKGSVKKAWIINFLWLTDSPNANISATPTKQTGLRDLCDWPWSTWNMHVWWAVKSVVKVQKRIGKLQRHKLHPSKQLQIVHGLLFLLKQTKKVAWISSAIEKHWPGSQSLDSGTSHQLLSKAVEFRAIWRIVNNRPSNRAVYWAKGSSCKCFQRLFPVSMAKTGDTNDSKAAIISCQSTISAHFLALY